MNSLTIAYFTMLRNFRDLKSMAMLTIFPILMMAILGTALDAQYTPKTVDKVKMGYFAEKADGITTAFTAFLKAEPMKDMFELESVGSTEDGISQVKAGSLGAFVRISDTEGLQLYSDKQSPVVELAVESFMQKSNLLAAVGQLSGVRPGVTGPTNVVPSSPAGPAASIENHSLVSKGKIPTGIDYYAVTQMFLMLFGALLGIFAVTKDSANQTDLRISRTTANRYEISLGKMLGCTIPLFVTSTIVFLFSKFVLQANWNGNFIVILAVLLLYAFISINLGMILAAITRNTVVSVMLMLLLYMIFTLASGGFSLQIVSPGMEAIAKFMPTYHAQEALFGTIYGGYHPPVGTSLSWLTLFAAVCAAIHFAVMRRRWS